MVDSQTATILVTDVVGSTELRVQLGEERADELRRAHDELLRVAVEDAGGTVIKGLGDGILALFSGAASAVAAAVAMQQAVYAYGRRSAGAPLSIRIGLSAGDVNLETGDCFGTPVVEASRLCAAANPGQILAAEVVRVLSRGRGGHAFTDGGERELKGLPEPVPVTIVGWEPPELHTGGVPFPARLNPQTMFPFSGRVAQREALLQAWKEATSGERRVMLVSGEPGIGKTRLTAEVARQIHELGGVVLYGRCDEDMGMGFQPFGEALEQAVAANPSEKDLGRYAGELVRLIPDLAERVGGLKPPMSSDPETERYRLFDAVAAWLAALSSSSGVLLVLDDLHWAERPTLLLLRHLVRSPEMMKLCIVGTYRDSDLDRTRALADVLADLRREPGVERLALSGLDVAGVVELLSNASDGRMDLRAEELAQLLWSETEGNPFFVQEILINLVTSGRIVQRDGEWTTDLEMTELAIPEGVREAIGRRLSRLSEQANALLALASVLGATIDPALLVEVSDLDEDAVLDALDEAAAAALLKETVDGTYEFTHALVRSTLYDELSVARRARRHRQVAEALERRASTDDAALAYHFRRAGTVDERAVDYAASAGEAALEQLAFDQAVAFFTQALEALDDCAAEPPRRCALLIRLGQAQRLALVPAFRETLLQAASLATEIGDTDLLVEAALANTRGFWSLVGSIDEERIDVIQRALQAIGPEDSVARARLLARWAEELTWHDPELRRLELGDEAVAMARRLGDEACLLEVWSSSHLTGSMAPRTPAQVAELDEQFELAERLGDAQQKCFVCAWGSVHCTEMGDLDRAGSLLARLEEIADEVNNPFLVWIARSYRTGHTLITGTGAEVEAMAARTLQAGEEAGQPDAFIWYVPQMFNALWAQGRVEEALEPTRQAVAAWPGLPAWRLVLAFALAEVGREDEAKQLVDELLGAGDDVIPMDIVWLLGQCAFAVAVATVGTPDQAIRQYGVLEPFEGRVPCIGSLTWPPVSLWLARLAERCEWPERAESHYADASGQVNAMGALVWGARVNLAWGRFRLSRGEPARDLLVEARETARRVGVADVDRNAEALLEAQAK
jgi:class 3 adenylate cyclase/tetratricopeptide (TPR) repeat protein